MTDDEVSFRNYEGKRSSTSSRRAVPTAPAELEPAARGRCMPIGRKEIRDARRRTKLPRAAGE